MSYNCNTMYDMSKKSTSTPSQRFKQANRKVSGTGSELISLRLAPELLEQLAEVGNEQGLSMSDTIRLVLARGLRPPQKGNNQ
jgi:hypothetical protein